jgi:hypothetical protein
VSADPSAPAAPLLSVIIPVYLRLVETPISYSGRRYAEGKKIMWWDGLVSLWCLLRYRVAD